MRRLVVMVAVLVAAAALAFGVAPRATTPPRAPTAVIDGWPIGAPKGICTEPVCTQMTRLGLNALDQQYPTHAAVVSSSLYGLGPCGDASTASAAAPTTDGATVGNVLVIALADGAVHAFGLVGPGADGELSAAPPLGSPYCAAAASGAAG